MTKRVFYSLLLLGLLVGCKTEAPKMDYSNLDEAERRKIDHALASMEVAEGLEVGLFAGEPMVTNPTNIAIDAKGRVWVCEALNYRLPYNDKFEKQEKGDRIILLEDTDRDGQADKRTVFYQGPDLLSPLGIAVLGDQVYVSASPTMQVFTDTDGDGMADTQDTLFITEGGYDHDHGLHSINFGPDGRLYFNFGNEVTGLKNKAGNYILDQEGRPIKTDGKPYRQGMALRCDQDGSNVEVLGHNFRNPYELTVDAFGNVWQSDNDDDGNKGTHINFLLEYGNYGYTDEITGAGWRIRRPGWEEEIPQRHWHQNDPGSVPVLRYNYAGSPTGITFYEGSLLPAPFQNQMIHCEALKNEVRAYPVEMDGAGYTADSVVILKSKDQWFRPSDVAVAPDGSILVSDWYDGGVGGHRMEDAQQGRIFRIAPQVSKYKVPAFSFDDPQQLKMAFLNPNQDVFYQASKYLEESGSGDEMLHSVWEAGSDQAKARALWMLARKADNPDEFIQASMQNEDDRFRVLAIRLVRQLMPEKLTAYLSQAVQDESAAVRREAAIALRYIGTPEAAELWATLARRYDGEDRWYLEALGIGSDNYPDLYMAAFDADMAENEIDEATKDLFWRIRSVASIQKMADFIRDPGVSEADIARYFRAFHFKPKAGRDDIIAGLLELDHPKADLINAYVLSVLDEDYLDRNARVRTQVQALLPSLSGTPYWLAAVKKMKLRSELPALLKMSEETDDRALAYEAISAYMDLGGVKEVKRSFQSATEDQGKLSLIQKYGSVQNSKLIDLWAELLDAKSETYAVDNALVNALGNGGRGQRLLYERVRDGALQGNLKTAAVLHMMRSWDPEVRATAPTYLASTKGKGGLLPPVARLVELEGQAQHGKEVFKNICSACHQVDGEGITFGPDLSQIGEKLAKRSLYNAILYPSAGINFGYEGYLLKTRDGGVFSGYIESETESDITIRMMGGISQKIARDQISELEPMDQSLMTANLQAVMDQQDLVDLVAYLAGLK